MTKAVTSRSTPGQGKQASELRGAGSRGLTEVAAAETTRRSVGKRSPRDDVTWVTGWVRGRGGAGQGPSRPGGVPALWKAAWWLGVHAAEDGGGRIRTLRRKREFWACRRHPNPQTEPTRSRRSGPGTGSSTSPTASKIASELAGRGRGVSGRLACFTPAGRRSFPLLGRPAGDHPATVLRSLLSCFSRSRADGSRGRKGQAPDDSEVTPCRSERCGGRPGRGAGGGGGGQTPGPRFPAYRDPKPTTPAGGGNLRASGEDAVPWVTPRPAQGGGVGSVPRRLVER